ncbi:MAG: VPLPA-CTERM sorting domain-containing protein [Parvularculaceae bacterium]
MLKQFGIFLAGALAILGSAQAAVLTTGTGDGGVTVGVDLYGSFGSSIGGTGTSNAVYNPVGAEGEAGTVFQSGVAISNGNVNSWLTTGSLGGTNAPTSNATIVSQTATSLVSTWMVGSLSFQLTQTLVAVFDGGVQTGSALTQSYRITNTGSVASRFNLTRYMDGDLQFDGSISDGGGRIEIGGSEVLYETDAAAGNAAATTFLGITGSGGTNPTGRFEVASFSGLRGRVAGNAVLANDVQGDTDGDGFINNPYDVTLALANAFNLAAGATQTYLTQTLWGNAVPPAPGSTEALPLLPTTITNGGAFLFEIDPADVTPGQIIWIDPDIAVGYTYAVTGATFDAVQMPSFGTVPDPDGYILTFTDSMGTQSVALASGATHTFAEAVSSFTITDIAVALMLDPTNPIAFQTGIALTSLSGAPIIITQTPIVQTVGDNPVPLPAGIWLMITGLGAIGASSRRKKAA